MPDPNREKNIFVCESTAYRRLKDAGLCERGVVPDYYGAITDIQPQLWPDLVNFHNDEQLVDAILLEYIPNMQRLYLGNVTRSRMLKLRSTLQEIHDARVLHDDIYPRNMMVLPSLDGDQDEQVL